MILFCDRNMGKKIPAALRSLGLSVLCHDDHFAPDTLDDELLERVGKEGWLIVTRDMRFLKIPSQARSLIDHNVGCFVLYRAASLPRWDAVRIIARNWDHIVASARSERRPFLHKLYLRHAVRQVDLPSR